MFGPITNPLAPESVVRMQRHVENLTREYGIFLCQTCRKFGENALAFPADKHVCVPPVKGPLSYATALHEIGHILHKQGSLRGQYATKFNRITDKKLPWDHELTAIEELSAWEWAYKHALVWTPEMTRFRAVCLRIYEQARKRDLKKLERFKKSWAFDFLQLIAPDVIAEAA